MDTYFIKSFLQDYFVGIESIEFGSNKKRDTRTILIHFMDNSSWDESITRSKLQDVINLFLLDKSNLDVMVDRDKFESVMFLTAMQGMIGNMINEYVKVNEPKEEDYEDEDATGNAEKEV